MAETWQERCRARGGLPVADPRVPGAFACKFTAPDGRPDYRSAELTIAEQLRYWFQYGNEFDDRVDGTVAGAITEGLEVVRDLPVNVGKEFVAAFFRSPLAIAAAAGLVLLNWDAIAAASRRVLK